MIALAIIFFAMGLFHIIRPDLIYRLTQSWKSYSDSDPSRLYTICIRISGVVWIAVGVLCIVYLFLF